MSQHDELCASSCEFQVKTELTVDVDGLPRATKMLHHFELRRNRAPESCCYTRLRDTVNAIATFDFASLAIV